MNQKRGNGPSYARATLLALGLIPSLAIAQNQAHCPLCAAGGYAASTSQEYRWLINSVYAPGSETDGETFLWYEVSPRLSLGLGYLWKQNAVRFLGSLTAVPETLTTPSFNIMVGVQGIGDGNPGYAGTFEKNWSVGADKFNAYIGVGFRSNENHAHLIGGIKYTFANGLALGVQDDGHERNPFVTYGKDWWTVGLYLVDGQRPAYLVGARF